MATISTIGIQAGQTLADIAIQQMGSMEGFFDLCRLNSISYTADLTKGGVLNYDVLPINAQIVAFFRNSGIKPASALATTITSSGQSGVGYWAIGNDFIIQ